MALQRRELVLFRRLTNQRSKWNVFHKRGKFICKPYPREPRYGLSKGTR
jgi:hypothetical protein